MRISTAQMFAQNSSSILQKQTEAAKLLEQLSSGKKVNTAGDDPVASLGIDNLNQQQALLDQFLKNIDYSNIHLGMAETKLGSAEEVVTSLRENILRGVNGGLSDSERQMIAEEMRGSLKELLNIANTRDESGNFIFAGFKTDTEPFEFDAAGNMVYSGDSGVRDAMVSRGITIGTNIPGDLAFMKVPNALGDYSVNFLSTQAGDFKVQSAAITNTATHVEDTYAFNFIDNGAGGVNLEVRDSTNALVTTVNNFDATNPVSFNGIEVTLTGKPAAGDSFTMAPQAEQSIFNTINKAITLIENDSLVNSPAGISELAQLLNNVDSGLKQLSNARSVAGNDLKSLESYAGRHAEEQVVNTSALSLLEDLDYASAITEFTKQQMALNAVSNVFSRVGSVSLFDYL